jgi:adenylyltransferase/sulfurtransferase
VHHQYDFLDRSSSRQVAYAALCGRNTVQINPRNVEFFDLEGLTKKLKQAGEVKANPFLLRFAPDEKVNMVFFKDGRVLVHGVEDVVEAKKYYSRYAGN